MGSAAHAAETSPASVPTTASRPPTIAVALSLAHLTRSPIAGRFLRWKKRGRVVAAPRVVTPFPGEGAGWNWRLGRRGGLASGAGRRSRSSCGGGVIRPPPRRTGSPGPEPPREERQGRVASEPASLSRPCRIGAPQCADLPSDTHSWRQLALHTDNREERDPSWGENRLR